MAGNCFVVEDPQIQPASRLISAITQANNAQVTTTTDHDYQTGLIIRFYVPKYYGMSELDKVQAEITVTGTDTFTVDINTTKYTAFAVPVAQWWHNRCAQIVPVTGVARDVT